MDAEGTSRSELDTADLVCIHMIQTVGPIIGPRTAGQCGPVGVLLNGRVTRDHRVKLQ